MKTAKEWVKECIRLFGYGVDPRLIERVQADAIDSPCTIDDPRMWKEQCRVGDVAFQHLFCTSKGKPMPDWVTERLPKMYQTLAEINSLQALTAEQKLRIEELESELENIYKKIQRVII